MQSVPRFQDDTAVGRNGLDAATAAPEPTIGALVKQLGQDLETLVRQEVALGKVEVGQIGRRLAKDGAAIGMAGGLGIVGLLTVTAGLVIILGQALQGRYWLSAFLVGAAVLLIAYLMLRSAKADMQRHPLVPRETIATLEEDRRWASQEAREFKQELTTNPARPVTRP